LREKKGREHLTIAYCRQWLTNEKRRNRPKPAPVEEPIQDSRKEECQPPDPEDTPGPEVARKFAELKAQMRISPVVGLSLASIATKKTIRPPTEDDAKEEEERRRMLEAQAKQIREKTNPYDR
jgi:hypothetical protein